MVLDARRGSCPGPNILKSGSGCRYGSRMADSFDRYERESQLEREIAEQAEADWLALTADFVRRLERAGLAPTQIGFVTYRDVPSRFGIGKFAVHAVYNPVGLGWFIEPSADGQATVLLRTLDALHGFPWSQPGVKPGTREFQLRDSMGHKNRAVTFQEFPDSYFAFGVQPRTLPRQSHFIESALVNFLRQRALIE